MIEERFYVQGETVRGEPRRYWIADRARDHAEVLGSSNRDRRTVQRACNKLNAPTFSIGQYVLCRGFICRVYRIDYTHSGSIVYSLRKTNVKARGHDSVLCACEFFKGERVITECPPELVP